ncbi:MAG: hypothetical protein OXI24_21130 [Candidatus Poribacteria bacterium]|nr:hypothetical protein [Candidatus Poribacteria bacterium]
MLSKKIWIPVICVLIGVAIGGTFWGQHIASQEPIKVYTPVAIDREVSTPKPPPPGETAESGHWHGDEWHAEPHEPVGEVSETHVEVPIDAEFAAYEASLSHFTEEELATYRRALRGEIVRHREKYPDCEDHEAVFEDADRNAKWYLKYKAHWKKVKAAEEEWLSALTENDEFLNNFFLNMSVAERLEFVKNMSEAERNSIAAKLKDSEERREAAYQKLQEIKQEEPIEPKRLHTH